MLVRSPCKIWEPYDNSLLGKSKEGKKKKKRKGKITKNTGHFYYCGNCGKQTLLFMIYSVSFQQH
jgi:hypothetical protein